MNIQKIVVMLVLFFIAIPALAETPESIIEKSFEKRGGKDKIAAIKNWHIEGTTFDPRMQQNVPLTIYFEEPDRIRMNQTMESMNLTISLGYDGGESAWMINPMSGSNEASDIPKENVTQLYTIVEYLKGPLLELDEDIKEMQYAGKKTVDEKECHEIKIINNDDDTVTVYFDAISYYLHKISLEADVMGTGQASKVDTFFKSPIRVGGVIMPEVIETFVDGQSASKMEFTAIKVNTEIDKTLFTKP